MPQRTLTKRPYSEERAPHFDSGIISEPLLAFGGQHKHVDPKTGLALYGPYSLRGQSHPTLRNIIVGAIGPSSMIADAEAWLRACEGLLTNDGAQPFLYPHFPGINKDAPFQCELVYGETWREGIKDSDLKKALSPSQTSKQIQNVVDLYIKKLEVLATREPRPNVVLCCIPQDVINVCTAVGRRPRIIKKKSRKDDSQLRLFTSGSGLGIEEDEFGHQNFRRALKARAMKFGLPTQLVWPRTLSLTAQRGPGGPRVQDAATRAWNFTTALYHKAGGAPWRLAEIEPGVCFVGVSFYRELLGESPQMRTSMAQAFTAAGDGYVLRGHTFEWNEQKKGRSPHLDRRLAAALLNDVLDLYTKQNRGSMPSRLVIHKTSRFEDDELSGFEEASILVPQRDFVTISGRGLQFYRMGMYPPLRGTYIKFSDDDLLFYTSGYVPYLRTYPGPRVPQPIEILEHHGDSAWDTVLREILALTKMNWNTADFSCAEPITIAFSRRVGEILAEVPAGIKVRPEYRFYM